MPLYEFACPNGHSTETAFPLADVPASIDCPACSIRARRLMAAPHLGRGSSPYLQAMDASARSAHEPEVVSSTRPGSRGGTPVTHDPRHAKLPRP